MAEKRSRDEQPCDDSVPKRRIKATPKILDGKYFSIQSYVSNENIKAICTLCNVVRGGSIIATGNFTRHYKHNHPEKIAEMFEHIKAKSNILQKRSNEFDFQQIVSKEKVFQLVYTSSKFISQKYYISAFKFPASICDTNQFAIQYNTQYCAERIAANCIYARYLYALNWNFNVIFKSKIRFNENQSCRAT